ncbi:MAG TPA: hypothetical protein VFS34_04810, partial [Thermoanaerobaculia bacterium]|nr:hypothetical protein [Thermoanaerobaculia bacterium]
VSWQVTGVRKDPWAASHRIVVRQEKPDTEKGYYIEPELYGQPDTKSEDRSIRQRAEESAAAAAPPEY